jgi:hypothetical protein
MVKSQFSNIYPPQTPGAGLNPQGYSQSVREMSAAEIGSKGSK